MSNEFTVQQLLERVTTTQQSQGNERVREITARIVADLFRTIDEMDVSADEFWAATDWLSRLGASGQMGLITAGLGFDRLLDIRADEADRRAGRRIGAPLQMLWATRDDMVDLYGDPLAIWSAWASDLHGSRIESGHHMAEENPEGLVALLIPFLATG